MQWQHQSPHRKRNKLRIVEMKKAPYSGGFLIVLAERTGLEPATLGVTGRYSNQLNYRSKIHRVTQHHTSLQLPEESGVPRGIRTPVLTVKG